MSSFHSLCLSIPIRKSHSQNRCWVLICISEFEYSCDEFHKAKYPFPLGREICVNANSKTIILAITAVLACIGLVACGGQATPPQDEAPQTAIETVEQAPPTVEPEAVAEEAAPPAEPAEQDVDENCLNCHTDEEVLKDLATEAEPDEALSSGEG